MASLSDEEVPVTEETGRRSTRSTRSAKNAATPVPPTPTRASRRGKKAESVAPMETEPEPEVPVVLESEEVPMESEEPDTKQVMEQLQDLIVPVIGTEQKLADEPDSNNLFDAIQQEEEKAQNEEDNQEPAFEEDVSFIPNDDEEKELNGADNGDEITGSSDNALAEGLANGLTEEDSKNTDLDAEMVSDEELPQPVKEKVHDAEEVSDDELPGPKAAELPAEAEVVSEDELPATSKAEIPEDAVQVSDEELPPPQAAKLPEDADQISDEELPPPQKAKIPEDADQVSDEELPLPQTAKLPEGADQVSDEELPPPQKAKLPEDAERVSDEELPVDEPTPEKKKRKSEDEEKGTTEKKVKVVETSAGDSAKGSESTEKEKKESSKRKMEKDEGASDKSSEAPEKKIKADPPPEPEKKKLPDLDKYWKAVNDDSTDFTAWTYLLQYVDQESDIEAAREAYDAFLSHYPYCYGYWRKYADYEKRKGSKRKCEEVFERGLKAIPLSVDLWIHFLTHVRTSQPDEEEIIRTQFERALTACGLEFRSDKLWEAYIKWETEGKRIQRVVALYDRLLATPTQGYANHFDHFKEVVNNNAVHTLVSKEEFLELRAYVRESARKRKEEKEKKRSVSSDKEKEKEKDRKEKEKHHDEKTKEKSKEKSDKEQALEAKPEKEGDEPMETDEGKPATDGAEVKEDEKENKEPVEEEKPAEVIEPEEEKEADDHVNSPEEADTIKDKIISRRKKVHKATVAAVTARWTYEEGIKRPYFHVKPLERCQLKNWKEYLDFEIEQGDEKRILVLFERCLIACALYDDFWLKLVRYLDGRITEPEVVPKIRDAYERACTIHHPDKPSLHLMWSAFEETQGNANKAAEILVNLEKVCPNLMQIAYRKINLERRRGDHDKCAQLYQTYIGQAKSKSIAGNLVIKYARFLHKIRKDIEQAHSVLKNYLEKDPLNTRVALQLIDLSLQRETVNEKEVVEIMDLFMGSDGLESDQKILFAQRKVEFLEDFGSTAQGLQDAQKDLQKIMTKANETKKKREQSPPKKASKDANISATAGNTSSSAAYATAASSYGSYGANASSYYGATSSQPYQYDSSSYGYSTWNQQYSQSGYGNYTGQWSGYGSYY
ncbi:pre-mRNA-processing factor 39 [Uranotaenia lowii]|uniref:pre-mRNA-processing factor 39 n=1 Tax=Uranotaenia lowii TaxID=190385 RepID=UPI0024794B7C|nr:pre-mRNA-processing factor 39 [Uranotaenia lowii]